VRNKFAINSWLASAGPAGLGSEDLKSFHALTDVATEYRPCGPENRTLLNQSAVIYDVLH
jgi:hypothetical protein